MKSSFFVSLLLLLVHDCADKTKPIILSQANGLPQRSVLPIRLDKATRTLGTRCSCYISLAKNVYACATKKITWSISSKVIGLGAKSRRNVVKMKAEMAAFSVSGSVEVLLPLWETESKRMRGSDIIIPDRNAMEHDTRLRAVLQRSKDYNLKLKRSRWGGKVQCTRVLPWRFKNKPSKRQSHGLLYIVSVLY